MDKSFAYLPKQHTRLIPEKLADFTGTYGYIPDARQRPTDTIRYIPYPIFDCFFRYALNGYVPGTEPCKAVVEDERTKLYSKGNNFF